MGLDKDQWNEDVSNNLRRKNNLLPADMTGLTDSGLEKEEITLPDGRKLKREVPYAEYGECVRTRGSSRYFVDDREVMYWTYENGTVFIKEYPDE